ncbi:hypothetical protein D3C81_1052160 [compost metagenome]
MQHFRQRRDDLLSAAVHPQRQQLHDQHLSKLVYDQTRQKVRFPVDQPVGILFHEPFPMLQAFRKPTNKKGGVHRRQRRIGYDADGNLRSRIVIPCCQVAVSVIDNFNQSARFYVTFYTLNFVLEDPRMPFFQPFLTAALQYNPCHSLLHSS